LHMAQLMPLPLTVSCFSRIQIGFTFLVLAHPGSPGKGPLNVCVCVCDCKTVCHFYCVLLLSRHDITRCVLKVLENVLWVTQEASGWIRFALTTISLHPLICGNEAFGQGQSVVMQWSHGLITPLHDIVSFRPQAPLQINSGEGAHFIVSAPGTENPSHTTEQPLWSRSQTWR